MATHPSRFFKLRRWKHA